jgi:hypothetical protein
MKNQKQIPVIISLNIINLKNFIVSLACLFAVDFCVVAQQQAPLNYCVKAPGLSVMLDEQGHITGCSVVKLTGQTLLDSCYSVDQVVVKSLNGVGYEFTRKLTDAQDHQATLTERFTPTMNSVRWEVEIISDNKPWTTAISTQLNYPVTKESRFWTSWGDPDDKTGVWQDPLVWRPFADRSWYYQYSHFTEVLGKAPVWFCIPLATITELKENTAITFVQSPEDTLLDLKLAVTKEGTIKLARTHYRLGEGRMVRFAMDLVAHPADCRAGLGWMVKRYSSYFDPPNPVADTMAGCAAYSGSEAHFDVEKLRKMAFRINWKCSEDFPYMGLFLPPMADVQARWDRAPDEITPGKPAWTSYQTLNNYSHWMRSNGFYVLNYFNVTEYGRNMQFPPLPRQTKNDDDLWKDPHDYLFQSDRRSAVIMKGDQPLRSNCYGALIVDPGDQAYQRHLLEQARRHIEKLPDSYGICIDRTDWLGTYNPNADDGVSWVDGHSARSLFMSWKNLMSKLGPLMHEAGKVIFVNNCTVRLETLRQVDGIYAEWASNSYFNYSALQGLRKPVMIWTSDDDKLNDAYFQRCLYLGIFPTAPFPNNNHCLRPSALADKMFLDYGPLLNAIRGRKWVLTPHCVESDTAKVNLFEVSDGYVLPVTLGGNAKTASVRVSNVPGLKTTKCEAIYPGIEYPVQLTTRFKNGGLELTVPLVRGCAMVRLRK